MRIFNTCLILVLGLAAAPPLLAVVVPDRSTPAAEKAYRHPDLTIRNAYRALDAVPAATATRARRDLAALGVAERHARLDARGGRFGTLILRAPLLPGTGVGNDLRWPALAPAAPADRAALETAAWRAFRGFVAAHAETLRIDVAELSPGYRVHAARDGELIQIHAPRATGGVPVRGSFLTAVLSHGNLVLLGAVQWGDVEIRTAPALTLEDATAAAAEYLAPLAIDGVWARPELLIVPLARGRDVARVAPGEGYRHRLAWALRPRIADELGSWELLVDAHDGEILAFEDRNRYATARVVKGGVLPVSNDGTPPDGVEQAGWPMPFVEVDVGGVLVTTDAGGNLPLCVDGVIAASLEGPFVRMNDLCGAAELLSGGNLAFGTSAGTDCATPGVGGPGNTRASRTGFYELNRIVEQARGQLPGNDWVREQLTANMNINSVCNAFWDGATVNFFRSGGGCANTGELAGVFDHEWGHGMDDNDVNPTISSPGEGIADLYAYLRLDTSCMGRGLLQGQNCGGYGDPCVACDGVRDVDWARRQSGQPHDVAWIAANCPPDVGTPCGGATHCEGAVYSEAVYDLVNRDLPSLFGMDHHTALELGTRLTYLGAGPVGSWFQCVTTGFAGCNADGGYLNYLAVDDDNGDLGDGTPHMSALFAAFDRHGIACDTPAVQDSGCAGGPGSAPSLTVTARDRSAQLSWGAVTGAEKYRVLRTDGVFGCDFGKTIVGETTGTTFIDRGLRNGREYFYVVLPVGAADACSGPASACVAVTPVTGPHLAIDPTSVALTFDTGDGDEFLDNCETATLSFTVTNLGSGGVANARILSAVPVSNPGVVVTSSFPRWLDPPPLGTCAAGTASLELAGSGLSAGDTLELLVEVASFSNPQPVTATLAVELTESDVQGFASRTYSFETGVDGWQVIEGTFGRTSAGGGAEGSAFYLASSANQPNQCDHVRSPVLRLQPTSTLETFTQFDIEGISFPFWYDRANVGIHRLGTGKRTPISPDGGRLYNASGPNGTCGTNGQPGWAGAAPTWASSTWSAGALGAAGVAGEPVQLDVRYGTDPLIEFFGFHFDEVTVTDVEEVIADVQPDVCAECATSVQCDDGRFCNGAETCVGGLCRPGADPCPGLGCGEAGEVCLGTAIFEDGFETGDTSAW